MDSLEMEKSDRMVLVWVMFGGTGAALKMEEIMN